MDGLLDAGDIVRQTGGTQDTHRTLKRLRVGSRRFRHSSLTRNDTIHFPIDPHPRIKLVLSDAAKGESLLTRERTLPLSLRVIGAEAAHHQAPLVLLFGLLDPLFCFGAVLGGCAGDDDIIIGAAITVDGDGTRRGAVIFL